MPRRWPFACSDYRASDGAHNLLAGRDGNESGHLEQKTIPDCLGGQDGIGKRSGGVLVAIRLERNSQACKNAGCVGLQGFANCDAVLQCGG